jgi:hypothetical protein
MSGLFKPSWHNYCSVTGCSGHAEVGIELDAISHVEETAYLCEEHANQIWNVTATESGKLEYPPEDAFYQFYPDDIRHMCHYETALDPTYEYCVACGAARKVEEKRKVA